MLEKILLALTQVILCVLLAPFIQGIIKNAKAKMQNRVGPSIFQPYRDLIKYFKKDAVISDHASWFTRVTPYICFTIVLVISLMIPMITLSAPLGFASDLILVIYLFALSRFFTALTALDAGSSFGGMGSSREIMLSAILEPALLLSALAILLQIGTTKLYVAATAINSAPGLVLQPTYFLAFIAMVIVIITETGRIPVDNPDTHLELTMIHEGMLLEYSGRYLGLMMWASQIKQLLIFSIFISLFFPWGMSAVANDIVSLGLGLVVFILKLVCLGVFFAVIETMYAKMRLFQVPRLLASSMLLSILAIIITVVK
ncbi:NADH-quinone oxidoreductase subunit H [Selenomonadales bacterium OttesenSCG-928-I06]|nr:NADH-quinone oxidoreductase subunit H [Selenomonadales bacterium OttesenSCG-928-I06]